MYKVFLACANVVVLISMSMDYRVVRLLVFSVFLGLMVFGSWVVLDDRVVIGQVVSAEDIDRENDIVAAHVAYLLPGMHWNTEDTVEMADQTSVIARDPLGDLSLASVGTVWLVGYGTPLYLNGKKYIDLPDHFVTTLPSLILPINSQRIKLWLKDNRLSMTVGGLAMLFAGSAFLHFFSAMLFGAAGGIAVWHLFILLAQTGALPMQSLAFYLIAFCIGVAFGTMGFRLNRGLMAWVMRRFGAVVLLSLTVPLIELMIPDLDKSLINLAMIALVLYPPFVVAMLSSALLLAGSSASATIAMGVFIVCLLTTIGLCFFTQPVKATNRAKPIHEAT